MGFSFPSPLTPLLTLEQPKFMGFGFLSSLTPLLTLKQLNFMGSSFPKQCEPHVPSTSLGFVLKEDVAMTLPNQKKPKKPTYSSHIGWAQTQHEQTWLQAHEGLGVHVPGLTYSPQTPASQLQVLTERRRHVTGRTSLGTPGQLHFLSSSANGQWWQWIRS